MLVKSYIERSMLVPDHVMTRLMLPRLEQLSGHSWLLDGKKKSCFYESRSRCSGHTHSFCCNNLNIVP